MALLCLLLKLKIYNTTYYNGLTKRLYIYLTATHSLSFCFRAERVMIGASLRRTPKRSSTARTTKALKVSNHLVHVHNRYTWKFKKNVARKF